MAIDLSALEDKSIFTGTTSIGKPMEIPLIDIEEDPNQPRTEFSKGAMAEITASIKTRGIKQPVSVRKHPSKPGKWMLNFGARRFRGSIAAGKETIPAFIDETSEDFDQVIENEQRDNLKPMELALFIQKKLDDGMKKAEIARKLGKDAAIITQHLALIAPPSCIEEIYRTGRCTSPKTLYELRSLYDKFSNAVEDWCSDREEITRKAVIELSAFLKGVKQSSTPLSVKDLAKTRTEETNKSLYGVEQTDTILKKEKLKGAQKGTLEYKSFGNTSSSPRKATSAPETIKKPLLLVEYEGHNAIALLDRRPSRQGMIYIRYENNNVDKEVEARRCKITVLTEDE